MQIYGPTHLSAAQPLQGAQRTTSTSAVDHTSGLHGADRIEISPEADQIGALGGVADMRMDRIAEIRQQIAAGVYETHDKLEIAVGRLLDELVG